MCIYIYISIYIYLYIYIYIYICIVMCMKRIIKCDWSLPATNPLDLLANDSSARSIPNEYPHWELAPSIHIHMQKHPYASTGIIKPQAVHHSTPLYILCIYIYTTILLPHILLLYFPIRKVKHHLKQTHMLYYSLINYRYIYHKP
jgi:hypothetical protein